MADINVEETKILLRQVWAFMLMGLYGIGVFQERVLTLQGKAAAESVLPDVAKVLFFGLLFVSFLIDIVEMREDKDKAFQFLFLSLIAGGLSATISAMQYHLLAGLLG
ncbi:MAG: hypothetical protein F3745_10145 [Nitrospinae bacterium]|nr:hypothetical protein [Nitrospinota bacterium]